MPWNPPEWAPERGGPRRRAAPSLAERRGQVNERTEPSRIDSGMTQAYSVAGDGTRAAPSSRSRREPRQIERPDCPLEAAMRMRWTRLVLVALALPARARAEDPFADFRIP